MDILQLLFFAALAVFLGVRLYMTLGKSTGRTPEDHARDLREREIARRSQEQAQQAQRQSNPAIQDTTPTPARPSAFDGPAGDGLMAIADADAGFDVDTFLAGARAAYSEIVESYARGDLTALQPLLSARVYSAYADAIKQREARGETVRTEIERLREVEVKEASLNANRARVKILFTAELGTETRDKAGELISGDFNSLKTVSEVWSFERDVTATDPNWVLAGVKPV